MKEELEELTAVLIDLSNAASMLCVNFPALKGIDLEDLNTRQFSDKLRALRVSLFQARKMLISLTGTKH